MQTTPPPGAPEKFNRYPCPACGADLIYEPQGGFLSCRHCGHQEPIPRIAEGLEERSFEDYLQIRPEQMEQLAAKALEVKCQSCGAAVTFMPPEVAGQCDFCGVQIVTQAKSADPILAPQGILPFRITQSDANVGLQQWLQSKWFAPNALKHFAQPDAIKGVYLPFWTYNTHTTSDYTGERGDHYYTTETQYSTDSQGHTTTHTTQVQHTNWTSVSGTISGWFRNVLVPGTVSLPQDRLEALDPWDMEELEAYNPAFLSGYRAQRYQVGLAEGFERVKQITAGVIEDDIRQDIGGDEQRIHDVTTHYSSITFKHLLLPVYTGAYRFNQKTFQIVVNGRTGEIQGDRPYSYWKIALLVMLLLFIALIIVLVFGSGKS